jgi:leader peptidase (prepilin peptidase)/N-methyltransferase
MGRIIATSVTELAIPLFPLVAVWCAALGAVIGSFLNVVIARVPARQSIVHPRSRCPSCGAHIRWYDNIPIASWLALRARCRACGIRISARYPVVEALGGALALAACARHGFSGAAAAELAFASALVALAFIDIDTWLLPNVITWPLIAFGLLMAALGLTPARSLRFAAYGAGLGFAAFALVAWLGEKVFKKEALGFGDVWLLAALGAWMGHRALLPVVLLASLQGSLVGVALIALGKSQPGPEATPPPTSPATATANPTPTPTAAATTTLAPTATTTTTPTPTPAATPTASPTLSAAATESRTVNRLEEDWIPPRNAVPFGPFLVVGALEWLWLGGPLAQAVPLLRLFR